MLSVIFIFKKENVVYHPYIFKSLERSFQIISLRSPSEIKYFPTANLFVDGAHENEFI